MKIIRENEAYVQLDDMTTIMEAPNHVPISILEEVFNVGAVVVTDFNRFQFVRFTEPEQIEFLKGLDYLVDYEEVKGLETKDDYIALGREIESEKRHLAETFCSLCDAEKEANKEMLAQCNLLERKLNSLRNVLWFNQGKIPMSLPDGTEPLAYKRTKKESIKKFMMGFASKKTAKSYSENHAN